VSKIRLTPNASGTGTVTLTVPSTSTDRTLTLPDTTGDIVTTGDSSTITAGMLDGDQTGSQPIFAARAWIRFNGTGTIAINDSGNVASITDLGTGYYRVTYTTAMSSTNYCVVGVARYQGWYGDFRLQSVATDKVEFYTGRSEALTPSDQSGINVLVFE
jgi:hypothetical protein